MATNQNKRAEGKAALTFIENRDVRTEEIRISFHKLDGTLWNELMAIPSLVTRLRRIDLQSPDITADDGGVRELTETDLNAFDVLTLSQLWEGVRAYFWKGNSH